MSETTAIWITRAVWLMCLVFNIWVLGGRTSDQKAKDSAWDSFGTFFYMYLFAPIGTILLLLAIWAIRYRPKLRLIVFGPMSYYQWKEQQKENQ